MEASLYIIEDLKNGDRPVLQLIEAFISETNYISRYDPTKVYSKGELIFIEDTLTKYPSVYEATLDGVTGTFNPFQWKAISLLSFIKSVSENNITVSDMEPLDDDVSMWIKPIRTKRMHIPTSLL